MHTQSCPLFLRERLSHSRIKPFHTRRARRLEIYVEKPADAAITYHDVKSCWQRSSQSQLVMGRREVCGGAPRTVLSRTVITEYKQYVRMSACFHDTFSVMKGSSMSSMRAMRILSARRFSKSASDPRTATGAASACSLPKKTFGWSRWARERGRDARQRSK